ncbi:MAG: RNA methyltransferase [Firmicutes bacterium]|nr:RNA methyltransferase [Bacillota bacterium]
MSEIIEITDYEAPELDIYARLTEGQLNHFMEPDKRGLFIAESPHVIERALDAGCEPLSFLLERKHIHTQAAPLLARCPQVPVYTADLPVLTQLTGFPLTRGILCAMRRPEPKVAEEICRDARRIVVLDNIMNPTNVGAIFRSAAALYMEAVLLTPGCSDPLYRRSARVSMGTVFQIPWARLGETPEDWPGKGMERLRRMGFKVAAMALRDDSLRIDDPVLTQTDKLAILLGSEGYGLEERTIEASDYVVRIPMSNEVDSLNVAAASAVAFWQLSLHNQ